MKFEETYMTYMEKKAGTQLAGCSYVEFGRLKNVLKKCPKQDSLSSGDEMDQTSPSASCCSLPSCSDQGARPCKTISGRVQAVLAFSLSKKKKQRKGSSVAVFRSAECPSSCAVCDAKFFGELMEELSEVVGCFNSRAEQLVKLHMATGLRKYVSRRKSNNHEAMIQEGQLLINYASMNAIAVQKILKKYDKVHGSGEGGIFKSRLMAMQGELLKSPYLMEMGALYLNLADAKEHTSSVTGLVGEFSCDFESLSPALTCKLIESATLDFDLTCPICLETLFLPVALGCGHLFCNSCACTAASVLRHEGPKTARCGARCAICRQAGVYRDAVILLELSLLIKSRCPAYWKDRRQRERKEQLKQTKEFYNQQLEILLNMRDSTFRSS